MSSPATLIFLTSRNSGASSFSNTTDDWGRSLMFFSLGYIGRTQQGFFGEEGMLQLWPLQRGVSFTDCRGYLLQHHGIHSAPPPTLMFPLPFLTFPFILLCLSSLFCPFLSMFSWRCHKLAGWAQLCPVVSPLWNWLCLAQRMSWSLLTVATPASNTLPQTLSTRGR